MNMVKIIKNLFKQNWSIMVIVLVALLLRLPYLNGSLWLDEAAQALESARPLSDQYKIADDFQPPFLHYLLHFVMYFDYSEWWLRLWGAVMPSLIVIVCTYLLTKKMFNKKIAFLTSIFLATSSFHIYLSQELRPYMWSGAWAALSSFFLYIFLQKNNDKKKFWSKKWSFLLLFIICSWGGLYSSYLYPFVFAAQLIILLWQKKWREMLIAVGIVILGFLPWLNFFLEQLQVGTQLRTLMPGWDSVVSFGPIQAIVMTIAKFIYGVSDLEPNFFYLVSFTLLILLIFFNFILKRKEIWQTWKKEILFCLISLIMPFLLAWLVSFVVPVIQPKRMIFLLPWLYTILSVVALGTGKNKYFGWQKYMGGILVFLIMFLNIYSLVNYWQNAWLQREDWRGLRAAIYQSYDSNNTVLLFSYQAPFSPWRWYEEIDPKDENGFLSLNTSTYYLPNDQNWQKNIEFLNNFQYVLLFDYLRDLTDPKNQLTNYLKTQGYQEVDYFDFPNIGLVRVFDKNY